MDNKKVVLITGAGRGLGKVIAQKLVEEGFIVYGTYNTSNDVMVSGVNFLKLDITSEEECAKVIKTIVEKEKRLDVLINSAGITLSGLTLQFNPHDFQRILDINVVGAFRLIKAAVIAKPKLIINITSLNGFLSLPNFGIYASSKFALEALGTALHYELGPDTQVVSVAPGALKNEESAKKMEHKPVREKFPLLNLIIPLTSMSDVAKVVIKLINSRLVPIRVIVGRDAKIIHLLQKLLPNSLMDRILMLMWKKK
ncbi:MAG: SDR family NAD(P)-dependent oxidoreductase [Candidatus Paceibacterota bacterium]